MITPNWAFSDIPFISGQELSRQFYTDGVAPLLAQHFPGLPHTAALIGYGSDVLGYDTPMSRDHMWGPRLVLLLPEVDFIHLKPAVDTMLRQQLPLTICGYPTHFEPADADGVRVMQYVSQGPVDHLVVLQTLPGFMQTRVRTRRSPIPIRQAAAEVPGESEEDDTQGHGGQHDESLDGPEILGALDEGVVDEPGQACAHEGQEGRQGVIPAALTDLFVTNASRRPGRARA
ncbi:MAG TPA: hypothetical protein PKG95_12905 [Anaerolineaceae bacterium]|nr:hypothetical protein [Anaerolineaceae bacterium]